MVTLLQPLIERGQHTGSFRSDVPAAWHLSMLLAIIHTASGEVQANRVPTEAVETALIATVLGAFGVPPD
jgi:hypothetical protein